MEGLCKLNIIEFKDYCLLFRILMHLSVPSFSVRDETKLRSLVLNCFNIFDAAAACRGGEDGGEEDGGEEIPTQHAQSDVPRRNMRRSILKGK